MIVSIALAGAFLRGLYGVLSRQPGRAATAAALALVLTGCNLTIVVPEGGRVLSLQGVECEAGESCTLEISTLGFFDSFSATANPGYAFSGWRTANMHLCAGGSAACVLDFRNVPSTPQILSLLASTTEFFLAPTFESTGADSNRYPVDQWRQLANSLNASGNRSDSFLYNRLPNEANCDPGELTNAAKNRFMLSVNLIRRLHYLPLVELDSFWDTQMQETSLVQLANNTLTHYPNTGHDCYTSGAAAGAGSSNLSYRSLQSDPAYYPLAWVNDSRNLSALMEAGHRRWVLHPHLAITAYGQTEGYASMKVFGFGQSFSGELTGDIDYIAVPYREYPYLMVERGFYPT
ncbi:MAG: hypothetical protein R3228_19540, partial [Halioglobus sp.]|nr:hypothetical protein [Halioglobus sp.]